MTQGSTTLGPDHPDRLVLPGRILAGRYQIERRIASGSFARVFLARDIKLGRSVAFKHLHPPENLGPEEQTELRRATLKEARAVARLNHSGIVTVYDADDRDGIFFVVMEYLPGGSLRDRIRQSGALGVEPTCRLMALVARAMGYVHQAGIVHRDLKPANVLLRGSDDPVLVDFGLAKIRDAASASMSSMEAVGTPAFMAPEQIRGRGVGPASDVFSLGCILYECLSGKRAYNGTTVPAVVEQVLFGAPAPLREVEPGCPAALEDLVERSLRTDPRDRPTADMVARELEDRFRIVRPNRMAPTPPIPPEAGSLLAPPSPEQDAPPSESDQLFPLEPLSRRLARRQIRAVVARKLLRGLRGLGIILLSAVIIALALAAAFEVVHYYRTGNLSPLGW